MSTQGNPDWAREPVPYGRPGWDEQLISRPDDYVANGYQPSSEYEWRASRRRPEFQAFVEWAYAQEGFDTELDYYDWGNDEATEALEVFNTRVAELIEAEAKARGMGMEWGDEREDGHQKVWLHDPLMMAVLPSDYSPYTVRSEGPSDPEGGE